jgi:hypothetical protein
LCFGRAASSEAPQLSRNLAHVFARTLRQASLTL